MADYSDETRCSVCGELIDESMDTLEARAPCKKCGSTKWVLEVSQHSAAVARDGYGVKGMRPSERRPFIEDKSGPDYSWSLGKLVHREMVIDRDNDQYAERVTDYESGETIHHCDHALSDHQGRGDAKRKK
jgi:hypothetical protein